MTNRRMTHFFIRFFSFELSKKRKTVKAFEVLVYTSMATVVTNTIQEIENLETLYLIWLSNSINIEIQQQLRTIINYFLPFEDKKQCLQYIQSLSKDDRIILIINGKYGQQIIPQIVHLQQIISIYVCSHDKKSTEHWTKKFKKVNY